MATKTDVNGRIEQYPKTHARDIIQNDALKDFVDFQNVSLG
jgi:hypothetical protein